MSIDWREWPQGNVPSEHRPIKDVDYLVLLRNGLTRVAYLDHDGEWRDTTTEVTVDVQWDAGVIRWAMIDEPPVPAPPSPREGGEGREALDLYYLQDSRGYVGNAVSWWRAGRSGYTCDPREAHVFTREGALCAHRTRCSDVPWPKDYVDSLVSTMLDAQRLDHGMALKEDSP